MIAVAVDQDGWSAVNRTFTEKKFWPGKPLPLTILSNPDSGVATQYGTTQFPESFFVDRNFKIVRKFVGVQNWTSQETTEWITEHSQLR